MLGLGLKEFETSLIWIGDLWFKMYLSGDLYIVVVVNAFSFVEAIVSHFS